MTLLSLAAAFVLGVLLALHSDASLPALGLFLLASAPLRRCWPFWSDWDAHFSPHCSSWPCCLA